MATYAQLDESNVVVNIVVADSEWVALQSGTWIEYTEENQAYIGGSYIEETDVFTNPNETEDSPPAI